MEQTDSRDRLTLVTGEMLARGREVFNRFWCAGGPDEVSVDAMLAEVFTAMFAVDGQIRGNGGAGLTDTNEQLN